MPFVQVNDVKLHYEIEGSGPPLLMIAGTGLPGATWRTGPSAQYAAEGFTVITFDHRGTGNSDKPDMDYSTRMFAADAVGLLLALDIPQAHVLGHSMGGRVAQWLALDRPERVRSLVLAAGSPGEIDPRNRSRAESRSTTRWSSRKKDMRDLSEASLPARSFSHPNFAVTTPTSSKG
jgi:pimeloyl-ACP methyl ester carboxylesterase